MALGTPVLARNNAGNAAIIQDGETGYLYDTTEVRTQHVLILISLFFVHINFF